MKDLIIIGICLIIIVILLMIGIETEVFDAVSEAGRKRSNCMKPYTALTVAIRT